ncbi:NAD-glutamate dehydrogenase domain-containing protein [Magnetococcus sp. PR-3]|uniref:NAD-glutamate dehydrogenase domain-containing protein n=1 Tax=Magnetococcus sp. PR-3 TaxID=3120355 RepID=UPI002FCE5633
MSKGNASLFNPETWVESSVLPELAKSDHTLAKNFLVQVLDDLLANQSLNRAAWCDVTAMGHLFGLFQAHLLAKSDAVKLHVSQQQLHDSDLEDVVSVQEGTRIFIHLHDTPFILDTVRNYLKQSKLTIYAQAHTTVHVKRNRAGEPSALTARDSRGFRREMVILILTEMVDDEHLAKIQEELQAVLTSVKRSVDDFEQMQKQVLEQAQHLDADQLTEEAGFFRWMADENFVFMGTRSIIATADKLKIDQSIPSQGVLRGRDSKDLLDRIMPGMREEIEQILNLLVERHGQDKTPKLAVEYCEHGKSIIYASEGVDFVVLLRPPCKDQPDPVLTLILGRFSRTGLASRASGIPILSKRLEETLALSGYSEGSYLHHEFRSLFDRMPLRELFYSNSEVITDQIKQVLVMEGDNDVRVLARLGHYGNYVSVLTAMARSRYHPRLEKQIAALYSKQLDFPISSVNSTASGSVHTVVCYANHEPGKPFGFNRTAIEAQVRRLVMTWEDHLREELLADYAPRMAFQRYNRYSSAFTVLYKEATPPSQAVMDIEMLDKLVEGAPFTSRVAHYPSGQVFIKLYARTPAMLTRIVQTFDNFGISCLHEFSSAATLEDGSSLTIQRFEVGGSSAQLNSLLNRADLFCEALDAVQDDAILDDKLNKLALIQGFHPKEVMLMVALRQYLLQIRPELSTKKLNRVLLEHHALAKNILALFIARFDPLLERGRKKRIKEVLDGLEEGLQKVSNLQDDQVLRALANVVESILRTNFYQVGGSNGISLKIDCSAIDQMPSPRPWREIFVLSPHMEGVHLRGGRVARGGLRFSDRLEDFRTEILGLMKTQMVKNSIIVPIGAKGGFIVPRIGEIAPNKRKGWVEEQYKSFIRGLLDITDNRVDGTIVHPDDVIRYDEADPYLVVAADKGTATFSDIANGVAEDEYGSWLGDAFASGGSYGYDHKKVGITARGAWECIRLHFAEQGHDIDHDPFTVVGIGDMSGDVFGNGLLATRQIKLVGAFNHMHIFLDPDPDTESSYEERDRLFKMGRSTWEDYNQTLISEGGGVFNRSAKAITLNKTLKTLLDTKAESLSGEQVIQKLLTSRVDLVYNGGIGTYVKARSETHIDVSDKANDTVRVDAHQMRCRIIGEGGNLGATQKARLEFAMAKGRVNTDAVDNSGGVDMSDHEVNLKILFAHLEQIGELPSRQARNDLLAHLTEIVAEQVLEDNRLQHMAISRDELLSSRTPEVYLEGLDILEAVAGLNFEEEDVPVREVLTEHMENQPMPRPLLAIMLGYTKLFAYSELLKSDVVDLFFFERYLVDYFPHQVARDYGQELTKHFLKREVVATSITNRVVNQTGVGPLLATYNKVRRARTDVPPLPILFKAYVIAENMVDAPAFRAQVHGLDNKVSAAVKYQVLADMEAVLLHLAAWMLTHLSSDRITVDVINLYGKVIGAFQERLWDSLPDLLSPDRVNEHGKRRKQLVKMGLSEELATDTVLLPYMKDAMTILHIKEALHVPFEPVGHLYIRVDDYFGISWIEENLQQIRHRDIWGRMNLENVRKELWETRTRLVKKIISFKRQNESVGDAFQSYINEVTGAKDEYMALYSELKAQTKHDLLPLSVLVRKLRELLLHEQVEEY